MQKIFIISLLLFGLMLMTSVSASLNVAPKSFKIDLTNKISVQEEITFINTFNYSIQVELFEWNIDNPIVFIGKTVFDLDANESSSIGINFFGEINDTMIFHYFNDTYNVEGNITISFNVYTNASSIVSDINVSIYPPKPYSGKLFVLAFDKDLDIPGFILLDDNIIPVSFKNGFTTVEVEQSLYGDADLWLRGEGFVYNFEVLCGIEGTAILKTPDRVTAGDMADICFFVGGEKIRGVIITVIDPEGFETSFKTDSEGSIYPIMDKTGEWIVKTFFKDNQIISKFEVIPKNLLISIDKNTYNVGEKVSISFDVDNVDVIVMCDNIVVLQQKIYNKIFDFYPHASGDYRITASTYDKQGSKSFSVKTPVSIRIIDENNMPTSVLHTDKKYIVQVIDEKNNIVPDFNTISTPYGVINLNNGLGFYSPGFEGDMMLTISDKGNYIGSSLSVTVEQIEQPDNTFIYMGIIITVVIVLLFLLYYLYSVGKISLPSIPKRKGIPDKIL